MSNASRWHTIISYYKSGIRIVGGLGALLFLHDLPTSVGILAFFLIVAEALGVVEEFNP